MSSLVCDFPKTGSVLSRLENLLNCSNCKQRAHNPCTLGGCEHIFCSICCENFLGKTCPVCSIPADVKDAQVNRQLFNIVTLCQKLRNILSGDCGQDNISNVEESVTDEDRNVTEHQRSGKTNTSTNPLSVYDLSSSSESEIERKKKSTKDKNSKIKQTERNGICENLRTVRSSTETTPKRQETTHVDRTVAKDRTFVRTPDISRTVNGTVENTGKKVHARRSVGRTSDNVERQRTPVNGTTNTKRTSPINGTPGKKTLAVRGTPTGSETSPKTRQVTTPGNRKSPGRTKLKGTDEKMELPCRPHNPTDQTTMTQFFDYMDEESDTEPVMIRGVIETSNTSSANLNSRKKRNSAGRNRSKADASMEKDKEELKSRKVLRTRTPKGKTDADTRNKSKNDLDDSKTESLSGRGQKRRSSEIYADDVIESPKTPKNTTPNQSREKRSRRSSLQPSTHSSTKKSNTDPLSKKNAKGETPLQIAAIKGDLDKVKELLQAGANPNTRDNAGWTPLHEAVHHGNTKIAELLLNHGAMIDVPGVDNDTPLHDAVCNYKLDCVKLLVSRGASITARNIYGLMPHDCAKTPDMKSALKTQVTSSVAKEQCVDVLEYQQPCLLGTFLSRDQKIMLQKCAIKLQAKVVEDFSPEVSHVILPCNQDGMCPRTIKYLLGVLTGKWIVNIEWIQICMDFGSRVCEEAFEIPGTSNNPDSKAAYKGRMNRLKQLPGLFDGCQFYFHGNFEAPSPEKDELIDLVKMGGGHILVREPKQHNLDENTFTVPYHAESGSPLELCCIYVVHDSNTPYQAVKSSRMCTVTPSWIMNCIGTFKLLDPTGFPN